jgi:pilus assembly protein CpaB
VSAETAAGGFVTPGDYVDVILTQGGGEELRAVTILQNIRVIAVDQDANERSDAPQISQTVTVDVTPQQGQTLALAQRAGRLSLMLRDFSTEDDQPMRSLRLSDVLLEESPVPEEVVRARTITVRRGTETETVAARGNVPATADPDPIARRAE